MYCAQLLEIDELSDQQRSKIDEYFKNVLPNGYATVSKAVCYTEISEKIIAETFSKLYLLGYLEIIYAVKCPECGHVIKKIEDIGCFDYDSLQFCYSCDEPIDLSEKDIIVLFQRKKMSPFAKGQHHNYIESYKNYDVAQNDSAEYLRSISYNFDNIWGLMRREEIKNNIEKQKAKEIGVAKKRAYKRYKKNKRKFSIWICVFRFISLLILFWILIVSKLEGNVSAVVTVVIYAFQNVIDMILKSFIVTDLADIEREEIRKAIT